MKPHPCFFKSNGQGFYQLVEFSNQLIRLFRSAAIRRNTDAALDIARRMIQSMILFSSPVLAEEDSLFFGSVFGAASRIVSFVSALPSSNIIATVCSPAESLLKVSAAR